MGELSTQSVQMQTPKSRYIKIAVFIIGVIAAILLGSTVVTLYLKKPEDINYAGIAIALVVTWFTVLIVYFSWAIYFYNINLGLTSEEWEKLKAMEGYIPTQHNPTNPHESETLGLPAGTIRGTIALTLLICSMALMVLGFDQKYTSIIETRFEFFVTAFQMMIAFYFGNKALDVFKDKPQDSSVQPITPSPALETEPTTNQATNGNSGNASSADAVVSVGG